MYKIYQVLSNETLSDIARKLGISKEELIKLNGFDNLYEVSIGESIIVPTMDDNKFYKYVVKKGDSIYKIAIANNIDYKMLLKINGLDENDYIYENQEIIIPYSNIKTYVTEVNDTFASISKKMNENIYDIINQNGNIYVREDQLIAYKKEQN